MKKLLIITLLVIMFGFDSNSQNSSRTYNGVDLDLIERVGNALTAKYNENIKEYYDFVNSAVINLDPDITSLKYKAQNSALTNFKNTMKSYVKKENWDEAGDDLLKAKSQYYLDLQNNMVEGKKSADSYLEKGESAIYSNNYTQAIYYFDEALKLNPNLHQVYYGKAVAYINIAEIDKAKQNIYTFINFFPNDPRGKIILNKIEQRERNSDNSTVKY